jgi:hypothetical protein
MKCVLQDIYNEELLMKRAIEYGCDTGGHGGSDWMRERGIRGTMAGTSRNIRSKKHTRWSITLGWILGGTGCRMNETGRGTGSMAGLY